MSKKSLLIPVSWSFSSIFSSRSFILSGLTFRSLLHFELNLWIWYKGPSSLCCMWTLRFSNTFCWRDWPLSINEGLFLGFLFCFISLCVCHYASTILFLFSFFFLFFWSCWMTCRTLVPQPGIKPMPPAVEAWSPSHWTAKEFPSTYCFDYCIFVVGFEIKKYKASTFVFLKIVWTIMDLWDSLWILG